MGDAGSTFVGFVIAWFAIDLLQVMFTRHQTHLYPITIFWVLSYPLYDLLAVILHRLSSRRSPFSASRDHLHYLLLDLGLNRRTVTLLLFTFSILLGLFGVILAKEKVVEAWQLIYFLAFFSVHFITTVLLQRKLGMLTANC